MRKLEGWLMQLALYIAPFHSLLQYAHPTLPLIVATAIVGVFVYHIIEERPRIQFILFYPAVLYHSYLLATTSSSDISYFYTATFALTSIASAFMACVMPVPKLPRLTGKYKRIGQTVMYTRAENPIDKDDKHELAMRVYYPSSTEEPTLLEAAGEQYMNLKLTGALAKFSGFPAVAFNTLALVRTHSILNAPIATDAESLPVVVYSHGLGGSNEVYTVQCEALASAGFVVFAPTHNDSSACISLLPDDRVIEYQPISAAVKASAGERTIRGPQLVARSNELFYLLGLIQKCEQNNSWQQTFNGYSFDTQKLSSLNAPFSGKLDLSRVGAVGHSFGAASVVTAAYMQSEAPLSEKKNVFPQIRAVVSHDQWMLPVTPAVIKHGISVPLLIAVSERFNFFFLNNYNILQTLYQSSVARTSHDDCRMFWYRGTGHQNFSDAAIYSPFLARQTHNIGPADVKVALEMINNVTIDWFQSKLKINQAKGMESWLGDNRKCQDFVWA